MSLVKKATLGAIWSIGSSVGARLVGLVGTLALTRFLTPDDYGAVSVAMVVMGSANIFTAIGFAQYLVASPNETRKTAFHVTFYMNTTLWLVTALIYFLRQPLGDMLGTPGMAAYIPGLALANIVNRLWFVPSRVLAREMRFGPLSLRMVIGEFLYAGVAVGLAFAGWGGHAIVAAALARAVVSFVYIAAITPWRDWIEISKLDREITRRLVSFGLPMWGANVLHSISRTWDNLIVAKLYGPAAVGRYNLAYNVADIPATQVGEQIGDVLLPSFAKIETKGGRVYALGRASGLLALVVFPMAVGLGAIAHTAVRVIFDERWAQVAPMLMLLSALSVTRPIGWLVGSYLQAEKRTRPILFLEVVKAACIAAFVFGLGQIDILWACVGVGVAFGAHAVASLWVLKLDGVPFGGLVKPLWPPLLACAPMVGGVLGTRYLLGSVEWPGWIALILETLAGGLVYAAAALVIARRQAKEFLGLIAKVLGRGKKAAASAEE